MSIFSPVSHSNTGALVGRKSGGSMAGSGVTGEGTVQASIVVGGLVGLLDGATIEQSFSTVRVRVTGTGTGSQAGGLVGRMQNSSVIANSFSMSDIEGRNIAGLVGDIPNTGSNQIEYSYFAGRLIYDRTERPGIAPSSSALEITSSYFDKEVTRPTVDEESEFARSTRQMRQQSTYEGWDFSSIWGIREQSSYPFLRDSIRFLRFPVGSYWNPYPIATATEFRAIRDDIEASYVLVNHIDLGHEPWIPHAFNGTLRGNGFQIRNVTIEQATSNQTALFSEADNARFYNVVVSDLEIPSGTNVAGLVGSMTGGIIRHSSVVNSKITVHTNSGRNGGLVAWSNGALIENSFTSIRQVGGRDVAGLVAEATGNTIIRDSYSTSDLSSSNRSAAMAGVVARANTATVVQHTHFAGTFGEYMPESILIVNPQPILTSNTRLSVTNGTERSFIDWETSGVNINNLRPGEARNSSQFMNTFTFAGWDFRNIWWMGIQGHPELRRPPREVSFDYNEILTSAPTTPPVEPPPRLPDGLEGDLFEAIRPFVVAKMAEMFDVDPEHFTTSMHLDISFGIRNSIHNNTETFTVHDRSTLSYARARMITDAFFLFA